MVLRPEIARYGSRLRKGKVLAPLTSVVLDGIHAQKNRIRLLNNCSKECTHTGIKHRWKKRGTGSLGYRILCLRISSGMRIRATVVRLTHAETKHTQTGKHGNRMPIAGLTSDSEPNKPTLETKCHLMDLYRTPSTQQ
jgi:hypothetical protein